MRVFALSSTLSLGWWIAQLDKTLISQWAKGMGLRYLPHVACHVLPHCNLVRHVKRVNTVDGSASLTSIGCLCDGGGGKVGVLSRAKATSD